MKERERAPSEDGKNTPSGEKTQISCALREEGASRSSDRSDRTFFPSGEEEELWRKVSEEKDDGARDALIIAYRPLVFWLARKFHVHPSSYQDLIQEGMIALIRAVDNFEPERHLKFTTYGFYRIKGQMLNFLQRSEQKAPIPMEDESLQCRDSFTADGFETLLTVTEEMKRLPAREGEIVQALLVEGKNAKDVARERGIDISHVYRLKRNGIARLRKWLGVSADATNGG